MREIYYIGGSTCCGKSSVADRLCKQYGLAIYKLDDYLDLYMQRLADKGNALCKKVLAYSMEEMWMRDPQEMMEEETQVYRDMFAMAQAAIAKVPGKKPILAEGAGFLPELMAAAGVDSAHYLCMTPTEAFQVDQYAQRTWIGYYLKDTTNPEKAFDNWMQRDALFAQQARVSAAEKGYVSLLVDGKATIEENAAKVAEHFALKQQPPRRERDNRDREKPKDGANKEKGQ